MILFKSSTADSYERLLKKTSRSSALSSSLSSLSSSTTTTTYRDDCDDYTLRVDDLVAEGLDHHCDWTIIAIACSEIR